MTKLPRLARMTLVLLAALLSLTGPGASADDPVEFKTATLAPEGSTWMNVFAEMDREVRAKTDGKVGFKFYPGGVVGDEKAALKKIKIGQLQAAALTSVGLSELLPESRILDLPYLYRDEREVDAVRAVICPRMEKRLEEAGYVALGWGDAGSVYLFSTHPVRSVEDLRASKVWVWEGDAVAESAFRTCGVDPIPLALPDVLTSLQTGLIDTVYISPIGAIALQWSTRVHTMTDIPIADALVVLTVQKKTFDRLSPEHQQLLRDLGAVYGRKLLEQARKENVESIKVLREKGIELVAPDEPTRAEFGKIAERVSRDLVGKIYTQELLDEVHRVLEELRAKK
ncbi:MAG: TRAP transporter substrate-binding protein DctP [Planctomycetes bacterium]|nr:TRAP transporter substrate-binding protein DctP [Planctomycetota bacterium]